jgi:hypothetical protein
MPIYLQYSNDEGVSHNILFGFSLIIYIKLLGRLYQFIT